MPKDAAGREPGDKDYGKPKAGARKDSVKKGDKGKGKGEGGKKNALTQKVGPLPLWAWGGITAAVFFFVFRSGAAGAAAKATGLSGIGAGAGAGSGGQIGGADPGVIGTGGGSQGLNTPAAPVRTPAPAAAPVAAEPVAFDPSIPGPNAYGGTQHVIPLPGDPGFVMPAIIQPPGGTVAAPIENVPTDSLIAPVFAPLVEQPVSYDAPLNIAPPPSSAPPPLPGQPGYQPLAIIPMSGPGPYLDPGLLDSPPSDGPTMTAPAPAPTWSPTYSPSGPYLDPGLLDNPPPATSSPGSLSGDTTGPALTA